MDRRVRILVAKPGLDGHDRVLHREARHADCGAGSRAKIEYRFVVEELAVTLEGSVLRIRCTALGRLPKGKSARSRLEVGAAPGRRTD